MLQMVSSPPTLKDVNILFNVIPHDNAPLFTVQGSFSQYGGKQAGNPPSPADTLTPPATPGGRTRTYSTDSTKHPQGEETKPEPKPEAKEKLKEKHKPKQVSTRSKRLAKLSVRLRSMHRACCA